MAHAGRREQSFRTLFPEIRWHLKEVSIKPNVLVHGEIFIQAKSLRHVADVLFDFLRINNHINTVDLDASIVRSHHAGQHGHRCGLAGTVGSDKAEDLAAIHREAEAVNCRHFGKLLRQHLNDNNGLSMSIETTRENFKMYRFACAFVLAIASVGTASAQNWPSQKPIRMIVPLPAGAAVDVVGRLICSKLGERLGQTIVVENRAGASGSLAADAVAKAQPDGYTLGMATSTTHVTTAILNAKLPYNPVKDFVPLAMIGIAPYVLTVYPKLPAANLQELLALAKAKPKGLSYSSVGNASLAHLATELMATKAGVEFNHVPYRSTGPAILDLAEGRIEVTFGLLGTNLPLIREGKIRPLAVTTEKRMPQVPDVPTFTEAGMSGMDASLWFAVIGPAALPAPMVERLNREINQILEEPEVQAVLEKQAIAGEITTPDKLRTQIAADIDKWRGVAQKIGIKPE
jgi:tripartite-type tricarboxylate transporter receptor subunit TctC